MQITAEEIRKITLSDEEITALIEEREKELDYKASEKLMYNAVKANEDVKEELGKLSFYDKQNWLCRTTYLIGYLEAVHLMNEVFKTLLADFVGGGYRVTLFLYRLLQSKYGAIRGGYFYV